jgi:hypothetical protein
MSAPRLRITGITEQVTWHEPDDGSEPSWSAAIGIEGLIPANLPGGYLYKYVRELISADGTVVNYGIITQAPGYNNPSPSVAIGGKYKGKGLPSGKYLVKISGGGQEDTMKIHVPDISEPMKDLRIPPKRFVIKEIYLTKNKQLEHVKGLYLEQVDANTLLSIERNDGSKYSAILKDENTIGFQATDEEINKVIMILDKLGERAVNFAQQYMKDDRKEVEFLHDIVCMVRYLSTLPSEATYLMNMGAPTELMHNRIVAQLLAYYNHEECDIRVKPEPNKVGTSVNDFNVSRMRCKVKSVQSDIELLLTPLGVRRLSEKSFRSLGAALQDDIDEAKEQVGNEGIIFVAPWSYLLNGVLRTYFSNKLSIYPPAPMPNATVLILTSQNAFEDLYVTFDTDSAYSELITAFNTIQFQGISNIEVMPIRHGLPMQATTAAHPGSNAGFRFKI